MPISQLIALASEESAGATPFLVGGGALLLLILCLIGILAFGKGREHS
jgi:hypothetical protein